MELHSFHLHQLQLKKPGELGQVFASSALRSFALALVTIFVPLYLLQLGYPLPAIFGYLAAANVFHALLVVPAAFVAARFGIKHSMLGSIVFEIIFFLLLSRLGPGSWGFLSVLALISGIQRALYFTGLHLDLAKFTKPEHRGTEIGSMKFLTGAFHALGPVCGGILLASFGFSQVFLAASAMIALAGIPLLLSKDTRISGSFSLRNIFRGRRLGDVLGYAGYGIESGASENIWALFLFLNVVSAYEVLGSIASAALVISLLADLLVGALANRYGRRLLRLGSVADAVVGLGRVFASTSFHAFAINSASGFSKKLIYIPADMITYDNAERSGAEEYIIFREITINAVRSVFYGFMAVAVNFPVGLLVGAVGSLLFLFL